MATRLQVAVLPETDCVLAGEAEPRDYRTLIELSPLPDPAAAALPLNLCLLLDCSGSMFQFRIPPQEEARWLALARERGEVARGISDSRRVNIWRGRTLAEMQRSFRKPIDVATGALSAVARKLTADTSLALVAFAEQAQVVVPAEDLLNTGYLTAALGRLRDDIAHFRLGHGTNLSYGLVLALGEVMSRFSPAKVNRIILISDGMVHDRAKSLQMLERVHERGVSVSAVGVGDDFDEEFLMRAADLTGGNSYFAAEAEQIVEALDNEFSLLRSAVLYDLEIRVKGLNGAEVAELAQVAPTMSLFEELWTGPGWLGARLPQIIGQRKSALAVRFRLPSLAAGVHKIGEAEIFWKTPGEQLPSELRHDVYVEATASERRAAVYNQRVREVWQRLEVYRREREAHCALASGDVSAATRKLEEAAQLLGGLGEARLAEDFRRQAAELSAGKPTDKRRTKRIKALSRRLAAKTEADSAPAE